MAWKHGDVAVFAYPSFVFHREGPATPSALPPYTSGLNGVLTPDDVAPLEVPLVRRSIDIGTRSWSLLMRPRDTLVARYKTPRGKDLARLALSWAAVCLHYSRLLSHASLTLLRQCD